MPNRVVAVVGAGAVGRLLAARRSADTEVHLILRSGTPQEVVLATPLCSSVNGGAPTRADGVHALDRYDGPPCDLVLVCVKGAVPRRAALRPLLHERSVVIPFVNGIEHARMLRDDYADTAVCGVARVFAEMRGHGDVRQWGAVEPVFEVGAWASEARREACGLLRRAVMVEVRECEEVERMLWHKFALITVASALAGLCRLPLAAAVQRAPGLAELFVTEAANVAAAHGHALPSLSSDLRAMAAAAGPNGTVSLQRDLERGVAHNELDYQLGAMIRAGHATDQGVVALTVAFAVLSA